MLIRGTIGHGGATGASDARDWNTFRHGLWEETTPPAVGRSCGQCHDGKHSFDVRDNESCASCHAGSRKPVSAASDSAGAAPAMSSLPQDFAYKRTADSPGQVTFRDGVMQGPRPGKVLRGPQKVEIGDRNWGQALIS